MFFNHRYGKIRYIPYTVHNEKSKARPIGCSHVVFLVSEINRYVGDGSLPLSTHETKSHTYPVRNRHTGVILM